MKALIAGGLGLVLALAAARSFAEDTSGRKALPTLGKPAAASAAPDELDAGIMPASYTVQAPNMSAGVGLGRPLTANTIDAQASQAEAPQYRAARLTLDRPIPVIRAQAPELIAEPLPAGPPLTSDTKAQAVKPPMPLDKPEYVPHMPTIVSSGAAPVLGPVSASLSDPCASHLTSCDPCATADCSTANCSTADCFRTRRCAPMLRERGCECGPCTDACGCCETCPFNSLVYLNGSFLLWAFEKKNLPPLVTASLPGVPSNQVGVLGQPTTFVLFDEKDQEGQWHTGARFNLGVWVPCTNWGVEAGYFFLGKRNLEATFASGPFLQVARPEINAINGRESNEFQNLNKTFGVPIVANTVTVNMYSKLWGLEGNLRRKLLCSETGWLDLLAGYRHVDMQEGLTISENLLGGNGLFIHLSDQFTTRNIFNGGQLGLQGERHFPNRFFVGGSFKVAMGDMHQFVTIQGYTRFTGAGLPPSIYPGGEYALPTNIGSRDRHRFAVVPEVNMKLGYSITPRWRIWAGYDFLYLSSVVRPGDQIDRRINTSQQPNVITGPSPLIGVAAPVAQFNAVDFWAQGVNFGMEYRW